MGEKVDFHLLEEDKEDEEPSLPVLLPLLLLDFLPGGKNDKNKNKNKKLTSNSKVVQNVFFSYLVHHHRVYHGRLCYPRI